MKTTDVITAMFFEGRITFEHHYTCDKEEKFCVCAEDGSILFLCTEEWWNHVRDTHPSLAHQKFECGCSVEVIVPNTVLHLATNALFINPN